MFIEESAVSEISEAVLGIEGEDNGIENVHEAMLYAIAENEYNFNAIMRPFAIQELAAVKAGKASETVWTEGALSNFWERAKALFMKIFAKIKGIFARFITRIDQFVRGGKGFFDKYKKQLAEKFSKLDKGKVKFIGYKFDHVLDANSNITGLASTSFSANAESMSDEDADKAIENYRSSLVGGSSLSSSEYSKALFEYFRSGESSKEEIDNVSFQSISTVLGNAAKAKSSIEGNYKGIEKAISKWISECEKQKSKDVDVMSKTDGDKDDKAKATSRTAGYPNLIKVNRGKLEAAQTYIGAQLKACADEISQAKSFAGMVLRAVHESVALEGTGSVDGIDDLFGSVKLR